MNADQRFAEIRQRHGHPDPGQIPGLKFVPAVQADHLLFLSGDGPRLGNEFKYLGKVPNDVSVDDAAAAAYLSGLNLVFAAQKELGTLQRVRRVVELFGMVNSSSEFAKHPLVVNGISECLLDIFGDTVGSHTRTAVGMAELPFNICFEARMTLHIVPSNHKDF